MNTDIYEVIFALLRSSLWGEEIYPFTYGTDVDWEEVNKELKAQTVHYLPIDILSRVDKENSMQYFQRAAAAVRSWHNLMQEQQNLYTLFQAEGIPFVILKGSAADCYYPKPAYRCMGDIDFIVKPEDFDRAAKCMEEHEYRKIDEEHQRHIEYKKNNVILELHRYFGVLEEDEPSVWLDNLIFDGINNAEEKAIDGFTFPMLPSFENGLVLLIHISQHMESGLGLRQIIDWMLYVDKEMTDEFWNASFGPAAEKIGLKTLAVTVTKMCQMYLGLTKQLNFCQEADSNLCDELMNYVMNQGNFGQKHERSHRAAISTLGLKNISSLFETLQRRGLKNWTIAQKYTFLRPLAWIYQLGKYIYLGLKREKPFKQLKEDYHQSKIHDDFLNNLQVTRRTNKAERNNINNL